MSFQINLSPEDLKKLKKGFINVSFVDDSQMQKLNKDYKGKDYPTDVLSFHVEEENEEGKFFIGDIVVNIDQAQRQASDYGNNLQEEVSELVGHGVLHLLGVHHEHDE
jgi:probable rRNA maturation factor